MSTLLTRSLLEASLALTEPHSRHAWRRNHLRAPLGSAKEWIEPLRSRDDAISEAKRIAEENPARCGWAWCFHGRWYAAEFRPIADWALGFEEIVTVEVGSAA